MKHIGIIVLIIGALFMIIPAFLNKTTNVTLLVGIGLEVLGLVLHIILNKRAIRE